MLEEYRHFIYKNEEERDRALDKEMEQFFGDALAEMSEEERKEVKSGVSDDYPTEPFYQFFGYHESEKLFEYVYEKLGKKYWTGDMWSMDDCRPDCPFGNVCQRTFIKAKGQHYCYGQLKAKGIRIMDYYIDMVCNGDKVQVVDREENIYFDSDLASTMDDCKMGLSSEYDFEFLMYIVSFGSIRYIDGKETIVGENVISKL